jgi:hypothetical protein
MQSTAMMPKTIRTIFSAPPPSDFAGCVAGAAAAPPAVATGAIFAPHFVQKAVPSAIELPHAVQKLTGTPQKSF